MASIEKGRPGRLLLFSLLGLSILGMSTAAPLVRLAGAPALVIAFWRMALAAGIAGGANLCLGRGRRLPPPTPPHRRWLILALAGTLLGVHFATWIASLFHTTVAASVVLVDTYPLFLALYAPLFLKEKITRRQATAILVAMAGSVLVFLDSGGGTGALRGNLLALAGAAAGAGYFAAGRRLRPELGLWSYLAPVYGLAALLLLLLCLLQGLPLAGYGAGTWLVFAALALGPTLLGHTLVNWSLRYLPAQVGGLVPLGEPVGAALLAAFLPMIAEVPGPLTLGGGAVILAGIALALTGSIPVRG